MLNISFSFEARLKFCDDADAATGITKAQLFFFKKKDKLKQGTFKWHNDVHLTTCIIKPVNNQGDKSEHLYLYHIGGIL